MDYENRPVPEGINYSQESALKDFALLALATVGIVAGLFLLLSLMAGRLAPLVPFAVEQRLAAEVVPRLSAQQTSEAQREKSQYLQELAAALLEEERVPEGMTFSVHYSDSDTVNAFATLGGHIMIYRGLVQEMPSENALAMVLAHEIAHVLHRDPIVAMGRGLTVALALASLSGLADTAGVDWLFQQLGIVTVMGFTREQERAADIRALAMVQRHYGNVSGAASVFEIFRDEQGAPPAFLNTHPLSAERVRRVQAFAREHPQHGEPVPLPGMFQ